MPCNTLCDHKPKDVRFTRKTPGRGLGILSRGGAVHWAWTFTITTVVSFTLTWTLFAFQKKKKREQSCLKLIYNSMSRVSGNSLAWVQQRHHKAKAAGRKNWAYSLEDQDALEEVLDHFFLTSFLLIRPLFQISIKLKLSPFYHCAHLPSISLHHKS